MFLDYIPDEVTDKFEFYNYNHAVEILATAYPDEWKEICESILNCHNNNGQNGIFSEIDYQLESNGWNCYLAKADLLVRFQSIDGPETIKTKKDFFPQLPIDRVKNDVAIKYGKPEDIIEDSYDISTETSYYNAGLLKVLVVITDSLEISSAIVSGTNIKLPLLIIGPALKH